MTIHAEWGVDSPFATPYLAGLSDNSTAYHPEGGNEIAVRYDHAGGGCTSNESTSETALAVAPTATLGPQFIDESTGSDAVSMYADWWTMKIRGLNR